MAQKPNKSKQQISAKQRAEREARAAERAKKEAEEKAKKERFKRIFVIAVCVILALALTLPTMGLLVLGGNA